MDFDNLEDMFAGLMEDYKGIPFGNSRYQNCYVVAGTEGLTPTRAYRHVGLRLRNRLLALKEAKFHLKREEIDIEELEHNIKTKGNEFDKRRWKLDVQEKQTNRIDLKKMINDAIAEVQDLYAVYDALPKFTKEQFEESEGLFFELKTGIKAEDKERPLNQILGTETTNRILSGGNQPLQLDILTEEE